MSAPAHPAPTDGSAPLARQTRRRLDHQLERQQGRSAGRGRTGRWMRWLHVYASMFSFVVVVFFGLTGITLNHPSWTFGDDTVIQSFTGTLPSDVVVGGEVELLAVSEHIRGAHDVAADVSDFTVGDAEGSISYKGPGYGADVIFDTTSLDYSLTVQQQGFVGVMNDLHKGRDTSTLWRWVIDISGALLVVVGLTGLGIQLLMRKRRTSALTWSVIGAVVTVVLIWLTMV